MTGTALALHFFQFRYLLWRTCTLVVWTKTRVSSSHKDMQKSLTFRINTSSFSHSNWQMLELRITRVAMSEKPLKRALAIMTEVSSEPGTSHSLIHSSAFNTFFPRNKWDLFLGTQTYKFSSIKRVMRRKLGSSCTLHFPFSGSVCFSTSRSKGVLPFTDPRSWPGKFSCVSPAVFLLPILISILRTTLSCLKSSITFQSASRPSSTLICWNLLLARLRVAGLWAPSSAYQ